MNTMINAWDVIKRIFAIVFVYTLTVLLGWCYLLATGQTRGENQKRP